MLRDSAVIHLINRLKTDDIKKWLDACEDNFDPDSRLTDLPISRQEV